MARYGVTRRAAGLATLVVICATSFGSGCALAHRQPLDLPQLTTGGRDAGVMPGSWERVEALRPGSRVVVTLTSGGRLEGVFMVLEASLLRLTDLTGRAIAVARSEVGQIVARDARDRLANGALIGAFTGLGAAAAILAAIASGEGYVLPSAKWAAPLLLSAAGGVVGVFIDRAHDGDELLYAAP